MDQQKIEPDNLNVKIDMLEHYIRTNNIEEFSVLNFLFDLKELRKNFKIGNIYRKLESEYSKRKSIKKVKDYYDKSIRVFLAARRFIKTNEDQYLDNIINSIIDIILNNYRESWELFRVEFDIS